MKKTKILAALLAASLCAGMIAGCSKGDSKSDRDSDSRTDVEQNDKDSGKDDDEDGDVIGSVDEVETEVPAEEEAGEVAYEIKSMNYRFHPITETDNNRTDAHYQISAFVCLEVYNPNDFEIYIGPSQIDLLANGTIIGYASEANKLNDLFMNAVYSQIFIPAGETGLVWANYDFVYTDKATSTKQFYTAEDISARMQELNEAEITVDARLVVEKSRKGDPDLHVPYKEYKVLSSEFYFEGTKSQNKKLVLEGTAEEFDPDYAHIVAIFYDKEGNVLSAVSRDFENYWAYMDDGQFVFNVAFDYYMVSLTEEDQVDHYDIVIAGSYANW